MTAIYAVAILVVLGVDVAFGATGDELSTGFLVGQGDNICLTAAAAIATPTGATIDELWTASCGRFSILEGSVANKFTIALRSDNTMFLTLTDTAASSITNSGTPEISFAKSGALVDQTSIEDSANQVFIIIADGNTDGSACLELDATYSSSDAAVCSTGGTVQSWYLVPACDDQNCNTCADPAVCTACNSGYRVSGSDDCEACTDSNCAECPITTAVCHTCDGDYAEADGLCACAENCLACSDANTCTNCASGYRIDGNNACEVCTDSNCETCDGGANMCTACASGYRVDSNACVACGDSNCETCDGGANICTDCASGYTDVSNACVECGDNCLTCSDADTCTGCATSYRVESNACVACEVSNCENCNGGANTCSACASGNRVNNNACDACDDANCMTCDAAANMCTVCASGYRVDSTNACTACSVSGCGTCTDDAAICTGCSSGYRLVDASTCNACTVSNCASCPRAVGTCTQCNSGYTLSGNVCNNDNPTEAQTTESGNCKQGISFLLFLGAAFIAIMIM